MSGDRELLRLYSEMLHTLLLDFADWFEQRGDMERAREYRVKVAESRQLWAEVTERSVT